MMPRPLPSLVFGVALLAGVGPALPRALPVRQTCDCCKLPCIEAEIIKAQAQRDYYRDAATNKTMTQAQYEAGELAMGAKAETDRVSRLAGLETCNYFDPNLANRFEQADLERAGFTFDRGKGGGIVGVSYTLATNLEPVCDLPKKAWEYAPLVTACEGIGAAQLTHEQVHIDACKDRRDNHKPPYSKPWQIAAGEVDGYDAEIAKLEDLRFVAAAQCMRTTCVADEEDWQHAADEMILSVEDVLQRGPHKPAPTSPTARQGAPKGN
jgi:hypothetical protein